MNDSLDLLILSNGPGEVSTWVRPVVKALRQRWGNERDRLRISLVLSPCPNSSGREVAIAQRYPELDRIQAAEHFWPFLLRGKTSEDWDWRDRGVVIFLGGDQFFPVLIGKRLGYRTVVYAEWEARWLKQLDGFGLRRPEMLDQIPAEWQSKCRVVGDLMADLEVGNGGGENGEWRMENGELGEKEESGEGGAGIERVGVLAGSKAAKLTQGIPFILKMADYWHQHRPQVRCFLPVAPTQTPESLLRYAQAEHNPFVKTLGSPAVRLIYPQDSQGDELFPSSDKPAQQQAERRQQPDERGSSLPADSQAATPPILNSQFSTLNSQFPYFETQNGAQIELYTPFPAHDRLAQCQICITTVGANTAELGALAVPMLVLLPTQQLDAMRAWNGIPGLLANLPGVGSLFAKLINRIMLRNLGLLAWPNLWAGEMIVPELVGQLDPVQIAQQVVDYLEHPQPLAEMRAKLRRVRGESGAAGRLVDLIEEVLRE